MDKTFSKETLCFYMVALASAIAAVAAMCISAFWRSTGGIAAGFGLFLPALILACFGFSYPSPLNKVRCAAMLGNTLTLSTLHLCLFVAGDLAGAKVVLYTVAGVFQPNAMGVLYTIFMGFGLLVAVMTGTRVMMQTFGKSFNDIERQLMVQSAEEQTQTPIDVTPRDIDEHRVLAKADQDVRMSRLSVTPANEEQPRPSVSPQEARAMREMRKSAQATVREEDVPQEMAPVADQPITTYAEAVMVDEDTPTAPVRSILSTDQPTEEDAVPDETPDIIYAQSDDVDDAPTVEIEMAHGESLSDDEIRTEMAMHRPRQKDTSTGDSLYTDFSYDKDPD
jgi:hypothetical protein